MTEHDVTWEGLAEILRTAGHNTSRCGLRAYREIPTDYMIECRCGAIMWIEDLKLLGRMLTQKHVDNAIALLTPSFQRKLDDLLIQRLTEATAIILDFINDFTQQVPIDHTSTRARAFLEELKHHIQH